ncbi:hypothetical protein BDV23DRAFT_97343 [Aspergillus alliaceus]|uniref:Thioester reductase (TE) domain-containing protein n=1 Tax=Petromyces alliaceus TaxID=209559 RepID=A0A5N7C7I3_PETAA|nr:hypothetical protein BDV23DRAFT_97343 [Aspergillus alliaceus]
MLNISKIVALPSQLGLEDLGLSPSVLGELRRSFTEMIYVAWAVNFTLGERSFEARHIRGIHKLINHCLSSERPSPAEFYFCSSISVAAATRLPATIAEAPIPELSRAQNMDYARSKLVAERIVYVAAKQTSMTARILRVGQNVGDSMAGKWNATEAIKLLLQTASILKSLPALDETIMASSGYRGGRRSTIEGDQLQREHKEVVQQFRCVFHVQNAKTFRLAEDLLPALRRSGLEFDVLPKRQWVQPLRRVNRIRARTQPSSCWTSPQTNMIMTILVACGFLLR